VSFWAGERDINSRSVGIELVNPGHEFGYRPFPDPQMAALERLATDILARHPIPPWRVLGHSDVAPARKQDPGELFDWARLAGAGIGLWPRSEPKDQAPADPAELQTLLARFGYGVERTARLDKATRDVVTAFQRRFRPQLLSGAPDSETIARLRALLRQSGL
jgi:N-acetylmuramoyl-L-alanine amidase